MKPMTTITLISLITLAFTSCRPTPVTSSATMSDKVDPRQTLCKKNEFGHRGIKTVCLLKNRDSEVVGFLLENANGTKSYLKVLWTSHVGRWTSFAPESRGDFNTMRYAVAISSEKLQGRSCQTSEILVTANIGDRAYVGIEGKTPGGREIQTESVEHAMDRVDWQNIDTDGGRYDGESGCKRLETEILYDMYS